MNIKFGSVSRVNANQLETKMALSKDAEAICELYRRVYDRSYPLPFGSDLKFTRNAIEDQNKWMVFIVIEKKTDRTIGAINLQLDKDQDIAIIQGLVIDPEYRNGSIGSDLVIDATEKAFANRESINSVFGTARVINRAPQKICLQSGYKPYGLYPNMYFINDFETMALVIKHREGVLENRASGYWLNHNLKPLVESVNKEISHPLFYPYKEWSLDEKQSKQEALGAWKTLDASQEKLKNSYVNSPIVEASHRFEFSDGAMIDMHLNKPAKHASITGFSKEGLQKEHLTSMIKSLNEKGYNYVQAYIRADRMELIQQFLEKGFAASAIYPAMKCVDQAFYDYVILSHSNQEVNFEAATFESRFYPYVENYLKQSYQHKLNQLNFFKVA